MKLGKKIFLLSILIIILSITSSIIFINFSKNDEINSFKDYLNEFEEDINSFLVDDIRDDYDKLIKEAEQVISDKDVRKFSEVKFELDRFKGTLLEYNKNLVEELFNQLKSFDLSEINSDSLNNKIMKFSELNNYNTAKEEFEILKFEVEEAIKQKEIEEQKVIENNYKILDGYWIADIEKFDYHSIRIDLGNNIYTEDSLYVGGGSQNIDKWIYNKEKNTYSIFVSFDVRNPYKDIGVQSELEFEVIDETHVKHNDVILYKVTYEQAIYCELYKTIKVDDDFDISINDNLIQFKEFCDGQELITQNISEKEAKEIISSKVFSEDYLEFQKELAEKHNFQYDPTDIELYKFNIDSVLEYYSFKTFELIEYYDIPTENDDGVGCRRYVFATGYLLPNGVIMYGTFDVEEIEKEILTYYN